MSVIQIVKQRLLGEGTSQNWILCKQKVSSVPKLFENIDRLLETFNHEDQYNLFYTVAHIRGDDSTRTLVSQEIIPFDVDDVDENQIEDCILVVENVLGISREEMGIIYSGNGLQFLILLENPIEHKDYFNKKRDIYKKICEIIQEEFEAKKVNGHVDPSVFSHARVMRVPNTRNIKKGKEKQARLLYKKFKPVKNFLEVEAPTVLPEPSKPVEYIYDKAAIISECGFLRWMKVNQNQQSEPQWYAMLSVLGRVDRELAHEYSVEYDEYDYDQTEKKIDQALKNAGPSTCHHINSIWEGCSKCPHFSKIKSPITLRGHDVPQLNVKLRGQHHAVKSEKNNDEYTYRFRTLKGGFGKIDYETLYNEIKKKLGNLLFHDATGKFHTFNKFKFYWSELSENALTQFIHQKVGPYDKRATKSEKTEYVSFVSDEVLELDPQFFNKPGALNFENGYLEMCLETGEVNFITHEDYYKTHDVMKGHAFTYQYDFDYEADAECSMWNKFLKEVSLEDQQMVDLLQEYVGAALLRIPNNKVAKALILHGEGANGKSVFLEMVERILHEQNTFPFGLQDCEDLQKRGNLVGKCASIKDEAPKRALLESDSFKTLVTGGTMDYRNLYQNPKRFNNSAKFFIACNDLPFSQDVSIGLLRRMLIVPFELYIPEYKQDKFLKEKLELELPGIVNWSVEGAQRFIRQNWRFSPFKRGSEKVLEYKLETNIIFTYIDEHIELAEEGFISSKEIWLSFKDHYEQEARRFNSQVSFIRKLKQTLAQTYPDKKFPTKRERVKGAQLRGIIGIKFKDMEVSDYAASTIF